MNIKKNAHHRCMVRVAFREDYIKSWESEWKPLIEKFEADSKKAAKYIWENHTRFKYAGRPSIEQAELRNVLRAFSPVSNPEDRGNIIEEIRAKNNIRAKEALDENTFNKFFSYLTGRYNKLSDLKNPEDQKAIQEIVLEAHSANGAVEPLWNYINEAMIRHKYEAKFKNYHEIDQKVKSLKTDQPSSPIVKSAEVASYDVVMEYLNNLDMRK